MERKEQCAQTAWEQGGELGEEGIKASGSTPHPSSASM